MTQKLIFSDIDGTLLNSKLEVSPKTRDAIRKQIIHGNPFIPVSARNPRAIMTAISAITKVSPMVSLGGALVLDEMGQVLVSKFMPTQTALDVCQAVDAQHSSAVWNIYSGYDWFVSDKNNQFIQNEAATVKVEPEERPLDQLKNLGGVHKILIMGEAEDLARLQKGLNNKFPQLYLVKSAPHLLEVLPRDVNKGSGVQVISEEFGVNLADAWAFGDNFNDEDMLNAVGHPVLMGNAPEELKQKFPTVTADNDHDGIAEVLEKIE